LLFHFGVNLNEVGIDRVEGFLHREHLIDREFRGAAGSSLKQGVPELAVLG
jgi:hypothetical protein